ncbi:MAG: succinate dehydrogenase assembly factor 2 [Mariprofundus sp.]|nr:succinate dehydrogenase assembly factor 2 [Mariprofundus sp.]
MHEFELAIRRLRYRLNRQGMLELDAWLSPLLKADFKAEGVLVATNNLLQCEPPELQAMMHGEKDVPECLKAWLL